MGHDLNPPSATPHDVIERGADVLAQVKPVCYLHRSGCTASPSVGIGFGAIADQDLDARMRLEPGHQWLSLARLQHVDGHVSLEVDQQRAVRVASMECEVIHAEHARCWNRGCPQFSDQPQEGIRTGRNAGLAGQPSASLAADAQAELDQQRGDSISAAGVARQHTVKALGKDLARAGRPIAEETPRMHD
jgi:hypothetical protein